MVSGIACAADKPDYSGAWRLESPQKDAAQVQTIEQKGNEIRISNGLEQNNKSDIACNTMGKDVRVQGDKVKVTYYYNGPVLVEMLMAGKNNDHIVKKRRTLSEDGKRMTVEVIPMVPTGKDSYKLVFVCDHQAEDTATASAERQ